MTNRDRRRPAGRPTERFGWDLTTISVLILVVVLVAWLTAELWLPHLGEL